MLDYSISYFLPEQWAQEPLYAEKLIPLIDYLLSNNFVNSDQMASAFYELSNKYQNTSDLPTPNIEEYIKENGYGYIIDLLEPTEVDLKIVVYLLPLIHILKGSETGIKIVLSLFKLIDTTSTTDTTIITKWYNELPVGEENTFSIDSELDVSKVSNNFYVNFSNFIKHYVYPELVALKVRYSLKADKINIPYIITNVTYTVEAEMST